MKKIVSILSLALLAGIAAYVSAEDTPAVQGREGRHDCARDDQAGKRRDQSVLRGRERQQDRPEGKDVHLQRQDHRVLLPGLHR